MFIVLVIYLISVSDKDLAIGLVLGAVPGEMCPGVLGLPIGDCKSDNERWPSGFISFRFMK